MRRVLCGIGLLALLSLAACGDPSTQEPAAAPNPSPTAAAVTDGPAVSGAPAALAFTATQVGGGTVNLAKYAGKTVLLWFWAPT